VAEITTVFPEGYAVDATWRGNGAEVADLPVFTYMHTTGVRQSVSAWKLSEEELAEVNRTGIVYLSIFGVHQPVYVHTGLEFQTDTFQAHAEPIPIPGGAVMKVYIAVPSGHVIGAVKDGPAPRTPHRVGWGMEQGGDWREIRV